MNYVLNFIIVFLCIYITFIALFVQFDKFITLSEKQLQIIAITISSLIALASCFFGGSQTPIDYYN